ncbi:uncharacterized protein B0I36DRAFT_354889 [Microdochium trichocladiopsis]|uniref:Uncharacterized protein n=1 Tax=Microdochium trichocladiopsis TaxID=1682393 RepID=A0A9P8XVR7_9PEZI|nr:uncharacterized protein B0I36DRAFT_354889 [Microdochium trichocladiopsis]KAH7016010.1 hypothetical protein B0I36DRAFT_354889 [Microdochium trichocladiopsis]
MRGCTRELQKLIIEAQARAEYETVTSDTPAANATCLPGFISDRSAIDPVVYARHVSALDSMADEDVVIWIGVELQVVLVAPAFWTVGGSYLGKNWGKFGVQSGLKST